MDASQPATQRFNPAADVDAVIVGAGFGGMYALHRLRGMGLTCRIFETGSGVGGTWYWNCYPGARCDVESMLYSYSFDEALQQEWEWTEKYAPQPEILDYANHVADRFDLRRDIRFNTRVASLHWQDADGLWRVETEGDAAETLTAALVVMATGCLSSANLPQIDGLENFPGPVYHTGRWPKDDVDFTGQRVAVIGTGSSGIQSIPEIAKQAAQVTVFQRTANYAVPAHNAPLDPARAAEIKANYAEVRDQCRQNFTAQLFEPAAESIYELTEEEREAEFEARWARGGLGFIAAFRDLLYDEDANRQAADFVHRKIRSIVDDPEVARLLTPTNIIGCKRLCVDTDYYKTFNRPNVTLVDVSDTPLERVTPEGIDVGGEIYPADAIVCATGFDAMTGSILKVDIRGRQGTELRERWAAGPRTFLGLSMADFPNLFTVTGPGSPSVLANMITAIEQHVDFIADLVDHMRANSLSTAEPELSAQEDWVQHVNEIAGGSLRSTCSSWYLGANVPGKPRVFMPYIGGFPAYAETCAEIAAGGYAGFRLA